MPAIPSKDVSILRPLAERLAEIGRRPIQKTTADLWRRLNRLEKIRPLIWINEIPWHELGLPVQCVDPFARELEWNLRTQLYQWDHFPGDMIIDPVLYCDTLCSPRSSYDGWNLASVEKALRPDPGLHGSSQYLPIINSEADVDLLVTPEVTVDRDETERNYQKMCEIFGGILPVEKRGIVHQWCAAWDALVHWYGIEQLFVDMMDRPGLVHQIIGRFMRGIMETLDRQEQMGLLSVSNGNHRVGSGGLGITDLLPSPGFNPAHVRPLDQWGSCTGQIFSEVSPDMHEEFCLQYERPYLARFGLNCYGCCEPLHNKMKLMRTIPRLRRISMSTWINLPKAVEDVGADYIFSYKPNPAYLAMGKWDAAVVRQDLKRVLDHTRGCRVELILKDVSTVNNEPARLWDWARIARDMVEGYA